MPTSSHNKWPWSIDTFERKIWFQNQYLLFCMKGESPLRTCTTLETISNLEELDTNSTKKLILKSKNFWSVSKTSHTKWPCLPVATISEPEALDTFQRDIWFWSQNPLSYIKSNQWLINWVFYLIGNFKAMTLTPQIWILLSEIYLEHFILSVFMRYRIKNKLLQSRFEITITHPIYFSEKHFGLCPPSIKN